MVWDPLLKLGTHRCSEFIHLSPVLVGVDEAPTDIDEVPCGGQESRDCTDQGLGSPAARSPVYLDAVSMSASSLFANLFTNGGDPWGLLGSSDGKARVLG